MKSAQAATSMLFASLFAAALPAQAQSATEPFNPFAMLAPIMTPFGMMLAPMGAQSANAMPSFNPATMFNPAMFNPAMMPSMPAYPGVPGGMAPFTGMQMMPQAYGMPTQMPNFMPNTMMNPFAAPAPFAMPGQAGMPMFPGFPFPGAR